ncbi:hypothetical protein [Prescottella equi]|uniref:hypothetical protein n=1 Tax=Rhodococcus hoagii TaxID=43767 RepID=UPI001F5B3999|nr:hypothetical protein [Prescottella equi]UNQ33888.1 hypothetical protein MPC39_17620 [Prescottella equi]
MHRSRSIATPTGGFTITCEVESAYPEPVVPGTTSIPVDFIQASIESVARTSGDLVAEVWTEDDGATLARFDSGTHRIYRVR